MLDDLKNVFLNHNQINYFRLNNSKLSNKLISIDIHNNELFNLEIIGNYSNLKSLGLNNNKFSAMNWRLDSLKSIYLVANNIRSLDNNMCQINDLITIYLNDNYLTNIDCLLNMNKLSMLIIKYNLIEGEISFGNLSYISQIDLSQNKV